MGSLYFHLPFLLFTAVHNIGYFHESRSDLRYILMAAKFLYLRDLIGQYKVDLFVRLPVLINKLLFLHGRPKRFSRNFGPPSKMSPFY